MAAPRFEVMPFAKGGYAVLRGGDLITRVSTQEQGEEYIARLTQSTKET